MDNGADALAGRAAESRFQPDDDLGGALGQRAEGDDGPGHLFDQPLQVGRRAGDAPRAQRLSHRAGCNRPGIGLARRRCRTFELDEGDSRQALLFERRFEIRVDLGIRPHDDADKHKFRILRVEPDTPYRADRNTAIAQTARCSGP